MKGLIAQQVIGLAEYYDKTLSPSQIEMFVEDLSTLSIEELKFAITEYRRNPENVFFPLPGKLISIIRPVITDKDEAQDICNLIISGVSRYGYTNPQSAKDHVGDLAWEVVNRMGGWKHLCETITQENEGMFRAQIRNYSETVSKKAKLGQLDVRPSLSSPVSNLIGETIKRIGTIE